MGPIEAKNIIHLSEREVGHDVHIVKEVQYDRETNTYQDRIKILKDWERPFWITKPIYQTYHDKKESELLKRVDMFKSTESRLYENISRRLGSRYIGVKDPRRLKKSPYLYGTDVDSRTILKYKYMKNIEVESPYRIGVFDIEVDTLTNEIIIISLVTMNMLKVGLLRSFIKHIPSIESKIREYYDKYIPETSTPGFKERIKNNMEIKIFDNQVEMVKWIFKEANYGDIDFLTGWNIKYDITEIIERAYEEGIDPADIFHYDKIPQEYKYFKFKEGRSIKVTEAGHEIPLAPEEQWHVYKTTSNFYLIDAMSTHRFVRTGGATVSGGYSLDNILEKEGVAKKLKFDSNAGHKGIEWHIYMVKNKPVEYIIYNIWDVMSIIELDNTTKDLQVSTPLLLGISHPDIFNSGPKRIVDALLFFYLQHGRVLGVKDVTEENNKLLGLGNWVVTLRSHLSMDVGLNAVREFDQLLTNIKLFVYDADFGEKAWSAWNGDIPVKNPVNCWDVPIRLDATA